MTRMVSDPALLLDQLRYPAGRPQPAGVAQRLGAALQSSFHPPQIRRAQTGFASCPSRLLQTGLASFGQLLGPAAHRLAVNADLPGDRGLAQPLAQEPRRLQSPSFQCFKVASHSTWVSHAPTIPQNRPNVTILYDCQ
jgi:hypothetical protein